MSERLVIGIAAVSAAGVLATVALVEGGRAGSVPLFVLGSILAGVAVVGLVVLGRIVVASERRRVRR